LVCSRLHEFKPTDNLKKVFAAFEEGVHRVLAVTHVPSRKRKRGKSDVSSQMSRRLRTLGD
jgi:hypothetical protein